MVVKREDRNTNGTIRIISNPSATNKKGNTMDDLNTGRKSEPTIDLACSCMEKYPCSHVRAFRESKPCPRHGIYTCSDWRPESEPVRDIITAGSEYIKTFDPTPLGKYCPDCGWLQHEGSVQDHSDNCNNSSIQVDLTTVIDPTPVTDLDQILLSYAWDVRANKDDIAEAKQSLESRATERVVAERIDEVKLWMSKRLEDDYNSSMYGIERIAELTKESK